MTSSRAPRKDRHREHVAAAAAIEEAETVAAHAQRSGKHAQVTDRTSLPAFSKRQNRNAHLRPAGW